MDHWLFQFFASLKFKQVHQNKLTSADDELNSKLTIHDGSCSKTMIDCSVSMHLIIKLSHMANNTFLRSSSGKDKPDITYVIKLPAK